jgi:hypothetical protein
LKKLELSWGRLVEDDKYHDKYHGSRVSGYHFNGKIVDLGCLVVGQSHATSKRHKQVAGD